MDSDTTRPLEALGPSPQPADPVPRAAVPAQRLMARAAWQRLVAALDPIFLVILAGAALLRFYNLDWDQDTHLHPDERFLTMVGSAARLPVSLAQYLDPQTSPLNPANVSNGTGGTYTFFVYGTLPLTLNKVLAVLLGNDNYNAFTIQGRFLSALADTLVVLLVFLTARLLERQLGLSPRLKYWATFFYAVAVLPIQLAHFYAVDSFLNLFMVASFYFALRYTVLQTLPNVLASAACFGLAVACKISAIYILPLDLVFMALPLLRASAEQLEVPPGLTRFGPRHRVWATRIFTGLPLLLAFGLVSYVALRLADPYMFQTANPLNPAPSHLFLANLQQLKTFDNPNIWYPPGVQWIHKAAVVFALDNLAFFGLGLAAFLFVAVGAYLIAVERGGLERKIVGIWAFLFFIYQSTQYVKTMRYFIFLYPFLALIAALGFCAVASGLRARYQVPLALALLVWPLAFMSIYVHPNSRVAASQWMYANLPTNSYILSELWDDPLPLPNVPNPEGKIFRGTQAPVFDPDTPQKWQQMNSLLQKADYYVLSSNRGWGSMPTVPERYPRMTALYRALFAGRPLPYSHLIYRRVAVFTSYPSLRYVGIPIDFPDDWAEEAFTVYDHPKVIIFQHVR